MDENKTKKKHTEACLYNWRTVSLFWGCKFSVTLRFQAGNRLKYNRAMGNHTFSIATTWKLSSILITREHLTEKSWEVVFPQSFIKCQKANVEEKLKKNQGVGGAKWEISRDRSTKIISKNQKYVERFINQGLTHLPTTHITKAEKLKSKLLTLDKEAAAWPSETDRDNSLSCPLKRPHIDFYRWALAKEMCTMLSRFSRVRLLAIPWTVYPTKLLCLWNYPGKNTGMGCHFLRQGIFPTQELNPASLASPSLAGRFFTTVPPGKSPYHTWSWPKGQERGGNYKASWGSVQRCFNFQEAPLAQARTPKCPKGCFWGQSEEFHQSWG